MRGEERATAIVGVRYSGRESMRVVAAIAACLLFASLALRGQSALEELSRERTGTLFLVDETVDVPPDDFRRLRLPRVRAGAVLWVKFRTVPEAAQASRSSDYPCLSFSKNAAIASLVCVISAAVCAVEMKPASNWEGAR